MIHPAVKVLYPVGYDQELGIQLHIVSGNLIKCMLVYPDHRSFALDNDIGRSIFIKDQDVSSFFQF